MIGINQFRLSSSQPRVAQPHRWDYCYVFAVSCLFRLY
jgi:hypothetical protein